LVPLFPAFAATLGWWLASVRTESPEAAAEAGRPLDPSRALDGPTLRLLLGAAALAPLVPLAAGLVLKLRPPAGLDAAAVRDGLSPTVLGVLGVFAACWLVGLGAVWRRAREARTAPEPAIVAAALLVLFFVGQTYVKAAIDPAKDLHPVTAAIREA